MDKTASFFSMILLTTLLVQRCLAQIFVDTSAPSGGFGTSVSPYNTISSALSDATITNQGGTVFLISNQNLTDLQSSQIIHYPVEITPEGSAVAFLFLTSGNFFQINSDLKFTNIHVQIGSLSASVTTLFSISAGAQIILNSCIIEFLSEPLTLVYLVSSDLSSTVAFNDVKFQGFSISSLSSSFISLINIGQDGRLTASQVTINSVQLAQGALMQMAAGAESIITDAVFDNVGSSSTAEMIYSQGSLNLTNVTFQNIWTSQVSILKVSNPDSLSVLSCTFTEVSYSNISVQGTMSSLILSDAANTQFNMSSISLSQVNTTGAAINITQSNQNNFLRAISTKNVLSNSSLLVSQSQSISLENFSCFENNIYYAVPNQAAVYALGGACLVLNNVLSSNLTQINITSSISQIETPGFIFTSDDATTTSLQSTPSYTGELSCTITNSSFVNNSAIFGSDQRGGAAFYIDSKLSVIVNGSVFAGNKFDSGGNFGGPCIRAINSHSQVTITDSSMTSNNARYGSNCLEIIGDVLWISNSSFDSNGPLDPSLITVDRNRGGALILSVTLVDIETTNFTNNMNYIGGAIFFSSEFGSHLNPILTFTNCTFSGNTAIQGGTLFFCDGCLSLDARFIDSNFTNNSADLGGVIYISYNFDTSEVFFAQSVFDNNTATQQGGVAYCVHKMGSLYFTDSVFRNNKAFQGAVEYGINSFSASIEHVRCIFEYNEASAAAVSYVLEMSLYFINCTSRHNHGDVVSTVYYTGGYGSFQNNYYFNETSESGCIIDMQSGLLDSYNFTFENCVCKSANNCSILYGHEYAWFPETYNFNFTNNHIGSGAVLLLEQVSGSRGDPFNGTFTDSYFRGNYGNGYLISIDRTKLFSSNLQFVDNQLEIFSATYGTITIESLEIRNNTCPHGTESCIMYAESDTIVSFGKMAVYGISDTSTIGINYIINSAFSISELQIKDYKGSVPLFFVQRSTLNMTDRSEIYNFEVPLLDAQKSIVSIQNMIFDNINASTNYVAAASLLKYTECSELNLTNVSLRNQAVSSQVDGGAIHISNQPPINSVKFMLENVTVSNFIGAKSGGAVYVQFSNILFHNCIFLGNEASTGGAIYFAYQQSNEVGNPEVTNTLFSKNTAKNGGGAIATDLTTQDFIFEPSNIHEGNSALYGQNFALAASILNVKVISQDNGTVICDVDHDKGTCSIPEVPSGQTLPYTLIFTLKDLLGQEVLANNKQASSDISIVTDSLNSSSRTFLLQGQTTSSATNGAFNYSQLAIVGAPNTSFTIRFTTDALSSSLPASGASRRRLTSQSSTLFAYEMKVFVRDCIVGEIYQDSLNTCERCPTEYFSVNISDTECQACVDNADCKGGNEIELKPGYWRSSITSTEIHECSKAPENCLGGFYSNCSEGYTGPLCQSCDATGEVTYFISGDTCHPCGSYGASIVKLVFILLFIIALNVFLIWASIREQLQRGKNNDIDFNSIASKIIINYLQVISIVQRLNLQWPSYLVSMFQNFSFLGNLNDQMVSIDCFVANSFEDQETFFTGFFLKLCFAGLSPFLAMIVAMFYWNITQRKYRRKAIQLSVASAVVIGFTFQSTVVNSMFGSIDCEEVDRGKQYVKTNFATQCWTSVHKIWSYGLVYPSLALWIGVLPLLLFWRLRRSREKLRDDQDLKAKYGFIYNSYHHRFYYWEMVIFLRKVCMQFLQIIFSGDVFLQALGGMLILVVAFLLQTWAMPFKTPALNSLELWSIMVSQVTLTGGLFYLKLENEAIKIITFIVLIIPNTILFFKLARLLYQANKESVIAFIAAIKLIRKLGIKGYREHLKAKKEATQLKRQMEIVKVQSFRSEKELEETMEIPNEKSESRFAEIFDMSEKSQTIITAKLSENLTEKPMDTPPKKTMRNVKFNKDQTTSGLSSMLNESYNIIDLPPENQQMGTITRLTVQTKGNMI